MNKDTVKGQLNDAAGRAKRQIGEWTNDPDKQAEGTAQQIKGKAQKFVGQVKDAVHDAEANSKKGPDSETGPVDQDVEKNHHRSSR